MFLDTTTKSIEIVLGSAKATNDMPVTVDYVDMTATTTLAGGSDITTNGVTVVTVLAAPAASTQRKVNGLTIYNADTVASTVTVRLNNNTVLRPLVSLALNIGDTLGYTDTSGWYVQDAFGNRKTVLVLTYAGTISALGYTPENPANKSTDTTMAAASNVLYPSQAAAKAYADNSSNSVPLVTLFNSMFVGLY